MTYPVFSSGDVLNASDMNAVGLWLVKTQTFTTTSPVDITGVFSSNFAHYRIMATMHGSVASFCKLQYLVGTTPETTASYSRRGWYQAGTTLGAYSGTAETSHFFNQYGASAQNFGSTVADVFNPNVSTDRTAINVRNIDLESADTYDISGQCTVNGAFTGFRLTANSGTLTGTIRVYGYRN